MKPGRGKSKGSAFERKVCEALSLWVTAGKHKDCFWRSSLSGGRATVHIRKGGTNRQAGDICAVAPEGQAFCEQWFCECKHVKHLKLDSFLLSRTGPLASFWKKLLKQAKTHARDPMLIARQNNGPIIVVTKRNYAAHLCAPVLTSKGVDVSLFTDLTSGTYKLP